MFEQKEAQHKSGCCEDRCASKHCIQVYVKEGKVRISRKIGRATIKKIAHFLLQCGLSARAGIIEPGVPANATIYVRNEGNVPVNVSLEAVNWSPVNASSNMELDWDCTG